MSRRPANVTQADLARAIRAAKQTGAGDVFVQRDGTIIIKVSPSSTAQADDGRIEAGREIVL